MNLSTRNLKVFVGLVAALFLSALASHANAATGDLSWTPPTMRADGTPLPATEIVGYRIEWGLCTATSAVPVPPTVTDVPGAVLGTSLTIPTTGKYCFRVATRATGDAPGEVLQSVFSPVVSKTWKAEPNPPTVFAVAHRAVYDLKLNADGTYALRINVGTTAIGTQCGDALITTGTRGEYRAVDRADVVFDPTKTPRSDVLVAYCPPAST